MKDIVTLNEFKNWVEHFNMYDLKKPKIVIERYDHGRFGRLILIRKAKSATSGNEYEYTFCTTREYSIGTIEKTFKELQ